MYNTRVVGGGRERNEKKGRKEKGRRVNHKSRGKSRTSTKGRAGKERKGTRRTSGSVASLVVLGEPAQVHVLDPRHPPFVLVVVYLLPVLAPRQLLLLLFGQLLLLTLSGGLLRALGSLGSCALGLVLDVGSHVGLSLGSGLDEVDVVFLGE